MQVDDAFIESVKKRLGPYHDHGDVIDATLAVAAERGLVVPKDAPRMWAVKTESGNLLLRFSHYRPLPGEKPVRVAVVEIKE